MISPYPTPHGLREKVSAALILILILVVYFNAIIFGGKSFMTTIERSYQTGHYHYEGTYWHVARAFATIDPAAANQINLPSAVLEQHYLKTAQLPLWNPYSGLGRPYHADMNSYTFFLPIYPFKIFPSLIMYDLFLLFRIFVAGFFLFLLLRLFRCRYWAAVAGASFYMLNSYFQAYIDMDQLNVTMWLTPMAYFLTRFLVSENGRFLLAFVLCSAGSFYGGNPNEFILIHLFLAVYVFFLALIKSRIGLRRVISSLLAFILAVGLSLFLAALKWLPFLEFWKHSVSSRIGGLSGTVNSLPFKKFLAWIFTPNRMFDGPNYVGFFAVSLVFFALINLIRRPWKLREKMVAFHTVLLFLIISKISGATYINWIGVLPLLKNINFVKYSSLLYYAMAVIASFSLTYLSEDQKRTTTRRINLVLFFLCAALPHLIFWAVHSSTVFKMADQSEALLYASLAFLVVGGGMILIREKSRYQAVVGAAVAAMLIIVVFEVRMNFQQHYRGRYRINDRAPYTQFLLGQKRPFRVFGLSGTLMPNCNLVYPVTTVNRIFALRLKRPTAVLSDLVSPKFNSGMGQLYRKEEVLHNPYLDFLNTKFYVSESILEAVEIGPGLARYSKITDLLDNPSMSYERRGDLYHYSHSGYEQLADSAVDIPLHIPYGDVFLKATALAFNFDRNERTDPENRLTLTISVRKDDWIDQIFHEEYIPGSHEVQDFFSLKADLSPYAGQHVTLNFRLENPGAQTRNDRTFFYGDLRLTYNRKERQTRKVSEAAEQGTQPLLETVPYEEVFSHHALVYKNNRAVERGFMLYRVRRIRGVSEAVAIMKRRPLVYTRTALIEGDFPESGLIGGEGEARVSFNQYRANRIKIDVETTANGVFILSDAYYPGWRAYLDKKRVPIYPAFGALRAVFMPEGKHELVFRYRPWSFTFGLLLTLVGLVLFIFLFFRLRSVSS